jgi:hypothetical protein
MFPHISIDIHLELLLTRSDFIAKISGKKKKFRISDILGDPQLKANLQCYVFLYSTHFREARRGYLSLRRPAGRWELSILPIVLLTKTGQWALRARERARGDYKKRGVQRLMRAFPSEYIQCSDPNSGMEDEQDCLRSFIVSMTSNL